MSHKLLLPLLAVFAMASFSLSAQCEPQPELLVQNECNLSDVSITLVSDQQNDFCVGEPVEISIDPAQSADWEELIYYWCDGAVDTISFADQPGVHVYSVTDEEICASSQDVYSVTVIGVSRCEEGLSGQFITTGIIVKYPPKADFNISSSICRGSTANIINTSCNGESYQWDFGDGNMSDEANPDYVFETTGVFTVRLRVTNDCAVDNFTRTVRVVEPPSAEIDFSTDEGCAGEIISLNSTVNGFTRPRWIITPNDTNLWCFADTMMNVFTEDVDVLFKEPGTYNIRFEGSNACGTEEREEQIIIGAAPSFQLGGPPENCGPLALTAADLGFTISGDFTGIEWEFTGADRSSASGEDFGTVTFMETGTATVRVFSACDVTGLTRTVNVNIVQPVTIAIEDVPDLCAGSDAVQLTATPAGGSWQGTGVNSSGIFDPGITGAGTFTLTYRVDNAPCNDAQTTEVNVVNSATVNTTDEFFCLDAPPRELPVSPPGGTWTGPGIIDSITGLFDPSVAGLDEHQPTYSFVDANGCAVTGRPTVVVEPLPEVLDQGSSLLCVADEDINLEEAGSVSATPPGGTFTWSGPGTSPDGTFNSGAAGLDVGDYTVFYTYQRNDCTVSDSLLINLSTPATLVLSGPEDVCIAEETLTLTSNVTGGQWSGSGIDPITGTIDLAVAGGGPRTYTYRTAPGSSCEQNETIQVEIRDPAIGLDAGGPVSACEGDGTFTFTGASPANGRWEGPGIIGAAAGTVDLDGLTPGQNFTYRYCIDDAAVEGCEACRERVLTYNPLPATGFSLTGTACINETFSLEPEMPGQSYVWDFGDGTPTVTASNPTHTYAERGNYTIILRVTSDMGCDASSTQDVFVSEPPTADFGLPVDDACAPFALELVDQSSGDDISISYLIDGTPFEDPVITFDSLLENQNFAITQIVTNGCGERRFTDSVFVRPYPLASFGLDSLAGCSPFTGTLFNNTAGNPDNCFFDFGIDGLTSTDCAPTLPAYTTGRDAISTYNLRLIATNECGVDTFDQEITVFPPDVRAFIQLDTLRGCQSLRLAAESFSSPGAGLSWVIIGPGGTQLNGGTGLRPDIILNEPGVHQVILTASGCGADADTALVEVLAAPVLAVSLPEFTCAGEVFQLVNNSGDISASQWDFGDGTTSTEFSPSHQYSAPGTFTLTYTAFANGTNCPATISQDIVVRPAPAPAFEPNLLSACPGTEITFNNQTTGSNLTYAWDFGDGTAGSTEENPVRPYLEAGDFTVNLIVTDASGCTGDTASTSVRIFAQPDPGFSLNTPEVCGGRDDLIATALGDDIGTWSVRDTSASGQNFVFSPPSPGDYLLAHTVENEFGCRDSSEQVFQVLPTPVAELETFSAIQCSFDTVTLAAISSSALRYEWYLEPSLVPQIGQVQDYVFEEAGTYRINLIAIFNDRCRDTLDAPVEITVFPGPIADFDLVVDEDPAIIGDVRFINFSTGADRFEWDLGDGTTSTATELTHEYDINRPIEATLVAFTSNGGRFACVDSITKLVQPEWIGSFEVPNAVSPDYGEPAVRVWGAVGSGVEAYVLRVYSPFGDLVWATEELGEGQPTGRWDATIQGEAVPQGAYSWEYSVLFQDGRRVRRVGTVTVLR